MNNIWIKIQEEQKKLDGYIFNKNNQTRNDTYKKRCIAFSVEFAELLNEIREFKFWSNKDKSDRDIILEEYVDGIHFLISISSDLQINFQNFNFQEIIINKDNLLDSYNKIFYLISKISLVQDKNIFSELFNLYISIGHYQGFSLEDIKNKYYFKNNINYERQDNGY